MRQTGSHTATLVALYRAIESARPSALRLFDDPFAPAFLTPLARWAIRLARLPVVGAVVPWSLIDGHWAGPRGTVAVRTRYIDVALLDALRGGLDQVVSLGAGFDCRAYRIAGIDRVRLFEADHPATQPHKREIVERRLGAIPSHVTLVPMDLATQALDPMMTAAGYRNGARTFFICEGLTHYLSPAVVDAVFAYAARSAAPGSRIVFTYIERAMLDGSVRFEGAENTLATVRRAGEPYTFGFDPVELPRYLAERGLRLIEDIGADAYRARYLVPRGRQREPLAEYQRAALAEVDKNVGM